MSVGRALSCADDWLNPGPTELLRFGLPDSRSASISETLRRVDPPGGRQRARVGPAEAGADSNEPSTAARWSRTHDPSKGYRAALVATLIELGVEVGSADV